MGAARLPDDEAERLRALHRYRVLDTPDEERFDRVTRMASQIFGVPIALVSLVDSERQWFKSRVGLSAQETSRDHAFCAHAILDSKPLVVNDASKDPRFRDNPLVTGAPNIRFYSGAPLIATESHRLGTLCVIDSSPRSFSEEEQRMLQDFACIVVDELELRLAAEGLQERVRQLELTEEIGEIGHFQIDLNAGQVRGSFRTAQLMGLSVVNGAAFPEASLTEWLETFASDDQAALEHALNTAKETGSVLRTRDRRGRILDVRVRRSNGATGERLVGVVQDVSEQDALRERVVRAERMATVGTLAAGVAHEINNPLSYIRANADVLSEEIDRIAGASPSARLRELGDLVDDICDGSRRIHRIVQGLKTFSRSGDSADELVELPRVLEIAERLCMNEVRHKAVMSMELEPSTPFVRGDEAQLVQVAVNLIVNAAHAIPEGRASEHRIVASCGTTEEGAYFEVSDTGRGMDEATLARIFEPFFTTKHQGVGTGLGLAISHGIVTALHGSIEVTSRVGKGTTFRVELPPAGVELGDVPEDALKRPTERNGRILVVDDEPAVGRAIGRLLRTHQVRIESSAEEALTLLDQSAETVDVVLCDMMMPHLNGWEFYDRLKDIRPDLVGRVIFVTGGIFTERGRRFIEEVNPMVIQKPIDALELRETVLDVLRSSASAVGE